jgi:hypothetical protein
MFLTSLCLDTLYLWSQSHEVDLDNILNRVFGASFIKKGNSMFKNVKLKSAFKASLITMTFSAMMVGHSYSQAGGQGGGGSGGGGSPGSGTYNGSIGPVPNNATKSPSSRGIASNIYNPKNPDPPEYPAAQGDDRNCVGEQRTSRDSTQQKGCDNKRLRVIVQ